MCIYIVNCNIYTSEIELLYNNFYMCTICDINKVRQRLPLIPPSVCNSKVSIRYCSYHHILCCIFMQPYLISTAAGSSFLASTSNACGIIACCGKYEVMRSQLRKTLRMTAHVDDEFPLFIFSSSKMHTLLPLKHLR